MTSQTREQALGAAIEKRLTGVCLAELKEQGIALSAYCPGRGRYLSAYGIQWNGPV